jgi:pyridoxal phosphate enzyme (YggS family)
MRETYQQIIERVKCAAEKSGRSPQEIQLLAVSKTKPVSDIKALYDLGQRLFGESRPQELENKIPELPSDIQWHMIGHLQTNKVKKVVGKVSLIHSVDSLRLATALNQESQKQGCQTDCLIQVNTSGEVSKFGFNAEDLERSLDEMQGLSNLKFCGLMTIGPAFEGPEDTAGVSQCRKAFSELSCLRKKLSERFPADTFETLSMGMSHDFEIAIEEGANLIRIGTAVFGERLV